MNSSKIKSGKGGQKLLTGAATDPAPSKIREKLKRLHQGAAPRVFDIFSGCGGLTLGFHRAGFVSKGHVEADRDAAVSYAQNFHADGLRSPHKDAFLESCKAEDFESPLDRLSALGYGPDEVDVLVGGPPCPAFSRIGRAKLIQLQKDDLAHLNDPRVQLYKEYIRYAEAYQPVALLMENVPELLNFGDQNLAEVMCQALEKLGYHCRYTILNSVFYGVPQLRERFFLMAYHQEMGCTPSFPQPTHYMDLPEGYERIRDLALRWVDDAQMSMEFRPQKYLASPKAPSHLKEAITIRDAIDDLPPITSHLEEDPYQGEAPQPALEQSDYAQEMRNWPGFEEKEGMLPEGHVTRDLKQRDQRIFAKMEPGDDYLRAHAIAKQLLQEELERIQFPLRWEGELPLRPSEEKREEKATEQIELFGEHKEKGITQSPVFLKKFREYVPPYDHEKFPNKWWKMDPEQPSRTLMAHLGKDCYTHIHYSKEQKRVLSVREAARLQSFPDGFLFEGGMNSMYRQIGNAVPPLLAFALAKHMKGCLRGACSCKDEEGTGTRN